MCFAAIRIYDENERSEESHLRVQAQLRHYTASLGCVDPKAGGPVHIDPCYENFRRLGGTGQQYCDDPYFGGLAKCCYDIAMGNCSSCKCV